MNKTYCKIISYGLVVIICAAIIFFAGYFKVCAIAQDVKSAPAKMARISYMKK